MATVRTNGRPHLVPVWFVWFEEQFYVGMEPSSVKARNLANNPNMSLSLEDGVRVVICEGTAVPLQQPYPPTLITLFQEKYGWDMINDPKHNHFIRMTPKKWLTWTGGDAEND